MRETYPDVPIVWGGPHPTTLPEQTLENQYVDYVIRDGGSQPLAELIEYLRGGPQRREEIAGLAYKNSRGEIKVNPPQKHFEILNFREIPYLSLKPATSTLAGFPCLFSARTSCFNCSSDSA